MAESSAAPRRASCRRAIVVVAYGYATASFVALAYGLIAFYNSISANSAEEVFGGLVVLLCGLGGHMGVLVRAALRPVSVRPMSVRPRWGCFRARGLRFAELRQRLCGLIFRWICGVPLIMMAICLFFGVKDDPSPGHLFMALMAGLASGACATPFLFPFGLAVIGPLAFFGVTAWADDPRFWWRGVDA